jgi:hypothetical protein
LDAAMDMEEILFTDVTSTYVEETFAWTDIVGKNSINFLLLLSWEHLLPKSVYNKDLKIIFEYFGFFLLNAM